MYMYIHVHVHLGQGDPVPIPEEATILGDSQGPIPVLDPGIYMYIVYI